MVLPIFGQKLEVLLKGTCKASEGFQNAWRSSLGLCLPTDWLWRDGGGTAGDGLIGLAPGIFALPQPYWIATVHEYGVVKDHVS